MALWLRRVVGLGEGSCRSHRLGQRVAVIPLVWWVSGADGDTLKGLGGLSISPVHSPSGTRVCGPSSPLCTSSTLNRPPSLL